MDSNRGGGSEEAKGALVVAFYLERAWNNTPAGIAQLFEVVGGYQFRRTVETHRFSE
jgi:hypothetical protein